MGVGSPSLSHPSAQFSYEVFEVDHHPFVQGHLPDFRTIISLRLTVLPLVTAWRQTWRSQLDIAVCEMKGEGSRED